MFLSSPHLTTKPLRIVSLVPSLTELIHYLGLEDETIAITKFCIHPAHWFKSKIKIGGTKNLNVEKIICLRPDLVIANKEENVKEEIEKLALYLPVWLTEVNNLADAYTMITDIGNVTYRSAEAEKLNEAIKFEFDTLYKCSNIPVCYLIWNDPLMTIGGDTFIHDMLEKTGLKNVFGSQKRYPEITMTQIKDSDCKLVLLSSEPYPFTDTHVAMFSELLPGIKVKLVDGEMFSWYGNRLLKSANYFKTMCMKF